MVVLDAHSHFQYHFYMIGIVDYNAGNITSVEHALEYLKVPYILSKKSADLEKCDKLIFPGVGEASYAMNQLKITGLGDFLKDWASSNKPLLGICLGSQIIFEFSEENDTECLGLVKGKIRHFANLWKEANTNETKTLKVPHIGWNDLTYSNGSSPILENVPEHSDFYFVHSYVLQPTDSSIIKAYADYGVQVPACIQSKNIVACQFHPEKSGTHGLKILDNYCNKFMAGGKQC